MAKPFVFPEHLDLRKSKRAYKVTENANASIDKANRVLRLFGSGDMLNDVFRHEMFHILFSPKMKVKAEFRRTKSKAWMECFDALEDARVNIAGRNSGLELTHLGDIKLDPAKSPKDPLMGLLLAVSVLGTDCEKDYYGRFVQDKDTEVPYQYIKEALENPEALVGYAPKFALVPELATMLVGESDKEDEGDRKEGEEDPTEDHEGDVVMRPSGLGTTPAPKPEDKKGPAPEKPFKPFKVPPTFEVPKRHEMTSTWDIHDAGGLKGYLKSKGASRAKWAKPEFIHIAKIPTLPIGLATKLAKGRALSRCAAEGSVIRRIDRLYSDGYIFRAPVRNRKGWSGGTILIDLSGSMSLCYEEVLEFLKNAPYKTTVYGYGGLTGRQDGWSKVIGHKLSVGAGVIVALAKNGKVAHPESFVMKYATKNLGMNCVDGPALDWLAEQAQPRCWISDGMVSGAMDSFHDHFNQLASLIVKEGAIKRFEYPVHFTKWSKDGSDEHLAGSIWND